MEHIGIVWNPSKTTRAKLEAALPSGVEATWHETSVDDPGYGAAGEAIDAGATLVIAAGGDGTVRLVAERLAEAEGVDLGIAPLGTGNLLARNLRVPLVPLRAAVRQAVKGEPREIDLGWVTAEVDGETQRHAFAVMAGFGLDANMIAETDDELKDKAGWLAYVESLSRAVGASEVIDVELTEEGQETKTRSAHTLIIGNCGTIQGGVTLLPDADPSDGELDMVMLGAENMAGWMDTMRNMLWDNGLKRMLPGAPEEVENSESTTHSRTKKLTIALSEPREFEIDGDVLGKTSRVEIEVQPGALRVR